jgi:hypothetical protein
MITINPQHHLKPS